MTHFAMSSAAIQVVCVDIAAELGMHRTNDAAHHAALCIACVCIAPSLGLHRASDAAHHAARSVVDVFPRLFKVCVQDKLLNNMFFAIN